MRKEKLKELLGNFVGKKIIMHTNCQRLYNSPNNF